ncbi:MAG TPA: pyridoxamine 5'-phosphate oxidase family protein [Bacteroidales bacterium]|jgi:nitroimidazol reductase NimA-like FMN-containing flavoprotein (pyridoxamine 5'-phosphate oxidase superfamily)|nr:pyridoxamine 5'-phosphate oxidase family protein [Bacteroidales bacterium]
MRRSEREITDQKEIEQIFESADVCRIAFADNNVPYIVTMNFGFSGFHSPALYFHCAGEGKKLEMIRKNNHVCFEMDTDHELCEGHGACDFGMKYRSVVGWGRMRIITDEQEKIKGLDHIMSHYSGKTGFSYDRSTLARMLVLKLEISRMTGKRCL